MREIHKHRGMTVGVFEGGGCVCVAVGAVWEWVCVAVGVGVGVGVAVAVVVGACMCACAVVCVHTGRHSVRVLCLCDMAFELLGTQVCLWAQLEATCICTRLLRGCKCVCVCELEACV